MIQKQKVTPEELDKIFSSPVVDHPAHYTTGKIEVIDYIEDQGFGKGFCLGNAIKYISRAGKKETESIESDIEKSIWYLKRYLQEIREEK